VKRAAAEGQTVTVCVGDVSETDTFDVDGKLALRVTPTGTTVEQARRFSASATGTAAVARPAHVSGAVVRRGAPSSHTCDILGRASRRPRGLGGAHDG
jgi:hypothetical protein